MKDFDVREATASVDLENFLKVNYPDLLMDVPSDIVVSQLIGTLRNLSKLSRQIQVSLMMNSLPSIVDWDMVTYDNNNLLDQGQRKT